MNCEHVRDNLVARQADELTADEAAAVDNHLKSCSACSSEAADLTSTLSLLDEIPEVTPSHKVWHNLSTEVDRTPLHVSTPARTHAFTRLLRIAAAASLLTAAISFGFVAYVTRGVPVATISHVAPGTDLNPGKTFRAGEAFTAPTFVVLTIPDVGTLKLDKGTTVRFDSRRRVTLDSGNLFAQIIPSGKGFEVKSGDATVTVHGTRFGVRAPALRSATDMREAGTVYVLEGNVSVESKSGSQTLTARQMATVGGPAKSLDDESLRWIAHYESPTIVMNIDSHDKTITRGGPANFRLSFRSTSPAPVLLENLRDLPGRIVLKVTDPAGKEYLANLDGCVSPVHARPGPNGTVRVDVSSDVVLDCRVTLQGGLDQPGTYTLSLSYGGSRTPESSGSVIPTDSFTIEVRN